MRNTITKLTTQDEQVQCFRNVAAHLEPGGCFVIEVYIPELQRLPPGETVHAFTVTPTHLAFEEYANHATSHGSHHDIGAALGGFIAYAALFLGWSLARNKAWSSARRSLLWITSIACVGLVASVNMSALIAQSHAKFVPSVLIGWPNRILIVAFASWMLALALRSIQLRRRQNARETLQPSKSDSTYPEQRLTGS